MQPLVQLATLTDAAPRCRDPSGAARRVCLAKTQGGSGALVMSGAELSRS
jgi:hypothetical protein